MAVKIRLQRHGKKGQAFFHIVVADGRAPRDGRFVEKLGTYNPLTRPAEIILDFDKALYWVQKGAKPTGTVRSLLSYHGVMLKLHLLKGVSKGALTEEQAEAKFKVWLDEKKAKIESAKKQHDQYKRDRMRKRIEAETKVNEAKAEIVAKKRARLIEAKSKENEAESVSNKVTPEEETPVAETSSEDTPVAEVPVEDTPSDDIPPAEPAPEDKE